MVAWGLTMAAFHTHLPLKVYAVDLFKCLISAFIMRSSACTINDIFDRKMDAGVGKFLLWRNPYHNLNSRQSAVVFVLSRVAASLCLQPRSISLCNTPSESSSLPQLSLDWRKCSVIKLLRKVANPQIAFTLLCCSSSQCKAFL